MSQNSHAPDTAATHEHSTPAAPKAPWHSPTLEEVDYSATESGGAGGIFYDGLIYNASS
jgi:hypothetical protein